jgi:hypothetical protein
MEKRDCPKCHGTGSYVLDLFDGYPCKVFCTHEVEERLFENTVQPRDLEDRMEAALRAADARGE